MSGYTSVSTKDLAVVDYAIVSQHRLHQCKNMKVVRAQELYRLTELHVHANPVHNISDHSMLMWEFQLCDNEYSDGDDRGTLTKKELRHILGIPTIYLHM